MLSKGFLVAQAGKNLLAMWETWIQSLKQDLLETEMCAHPSILSWSKGTWQATVHGVPKSDATE